MIKLFWEIHYAYTWTLIHTKQYQHNILLLRTWPEYFTCIWWLSVSKIHLTPTKIPMQQMDEQSLDLGFTIVVINAYPLNLMLGCLNWILKRYFEHLHGIWMFNFTLQIKSGTVPEMKAKKLPEIILA